MNGFSILFTLFLFLLAGIFFIGIAVLVVGLVKKGKQNSLRKAGLIITGFPILIIAIIFSYDFIFEHFTFKPTEKDLVGVYHIVKAEGLIPKQFYHSYALEFKSDGNFYMNPTPMISICEKGKYSVDWQLSLSEVSFECAGRISTAHIDRSFSGYKIEFIFGDPDEGQSIYFAKDK